MDDNAGVKACWPWNHRWQKWEQYVWDGTVTYPMIGTVVSELAGKPIPVTENRQRRRCEQCGKMQDRKVSG